MNFVDVWRHFGASFWHIRTLKRGLSWEFLTKPCLSAKPIQFVVRNPQKKKVMRELIQTMFLKGAIESVPKPVTPGFISCVKNTY